MVVCSLIAIKHPRFICHHLPLSLISLSPGYDQDLSQTDSKHQPLLCHIPSLFQPFKSLTKHSMRPESRTHPNKDPQQRASHPLAQPRPRSLDSAAVSPEASPRAILAFVPLLSSCQLAAEDKRLPRLDHSCVSSGARWAGSLAWGAHMSSSRLQAPAYIATACIRSFHWAGQRKSRHPTVSRWTSGNWPIHGFRGSQTLAVV